MCNNRAEAIEVNDQANIVIDDKSSIRLQRLLKSTSEQHSVQWGDLPADALWQKSQQFLQKYMID